MGDENRESAEAIYKNLLVWQKGMELVKVVLL